jgi:NADP-reducing hydrogenase subunit HndC
MRLVQSQGYVYCRAEYPIAVKTIKQPLNRPGDWVCWVMISSGTGFSFDLEVRMGAGAFVCGEETALMASIEGFTR